MSLEEQNGADGVQVTAGMNSADWASDLWRRGCERLATELPEQQFNTWIRPLPPATVAGESADAASALIATLKVPNHFKRDWIRRQYAARIEAILTELAGRPTRLELALVAREPSAAAISLPATQAPTFQPPTTQAMEPSAALKPVVQPSASTVMSGCCRKNCRSSASAGLSRAAISPIASASPLI